MRPTREEREREKRIKDREEQTARELFEHPDEVELAMRSIVLRGWASLRSEEIRLLGDLRTGNPDELKRTRAQSAAYSVLTKAIKDRRDARVALIASQKKQPWSWGEVMGSVGVVAVFLVFVLGWLDIAWRLLRWVMH